MGYQGINSVCLTQYRLDIWPRLVRNYVYLDLSILHCVNLDRYM